MFNLRPYQAQAVEAGVKHLTGRSKKPGVIVVPTGGGKSIIIGSIVKELKSPTIVLQPSREILLQNYEKAVSYGMTPTIYSASCKSKEMSDLTYATLKSIKKEDLKGRGISYLIADECHFSYSANKGSEFMKFIEGIGDCKVLGLTATPCRLHNYTSMMEGNYSKLNMLNKDDPRFFDKIVHVTQIRELTSQKFWTEIKYEVWDFDESQLLLNSTGAEYTEDSIARCIQKNGTNNAIYIRIMDLLKERKHILVCMESVEKCERLSSFMNERMGYITDFVTSKTSDKKRADIIRKFKEGELKVVFNYSALATGFDFPELDCVIFGRPTFSFTTYYQFVGRGVRIHPDKKDCLFVDCCNNFKKFGRIEDLSIEYMPGEGWCMFSGNRLITGIHMGDTVMRDELMQRAAALGLLKTVNEDGRRSHPLDDHIMWFGKYEGKSFKNIPISYFRFIVDKFDLNNEKMKKIEEYYKGIII